MPAGIPQPNTDAVFVEINAFLAKTSHYRSPQEWDVKRLARLAEQLVKAEPAEGYRALAAIYQTTGDRALVDKYMDNAIQWSNNKALAHLQKASMLSNLGHFSDSCGIFSNCAAPEKGQMSVAWERGYVCGAFRAMKAYAEKAKKMNLNNLEGLDIDTAVRAANVLEKSGGSDADVLAVLDVVGKVMRERSLFFMGPGPVVSVTDTADSFEPFIEMAFEFELTPKDAHSMYSQFVDQVLQDVPTAPSALSVTFRSWKRQDERNAA